MSGVIILLNVLLFNVFEKIKAPVFLKISVISVVGVISFYLTDLVPSISTLKPFVRVMPTSPVYYLLFPWYFVARTLSTKKTPLTLAIYLLPLVLVFGEVWLKSSAVLLYLLLNERKNSFQIVIISFVLFLNLTTSLFGLSEYVLSSINGICLIAIFIFELNVFKNIKNGKEELLFLGLTIITLFASDKFAIWVAGKNINLYLLVVSYVGFSLLKGQFKLVLGSMLTFFYILDYDSFQNITMAVFVILISEVTEYNGEIKKITSFQKSIIDKLLVSMIIASFVVFFTTQSFSYLELLINLVVGILILRDYFTVKTAEKHGGFTQVGLIAITMVCLGAGLI